MTTDDFEQFTKGLVAVADVFDAELSQSKIMLYFQALEDLDTYDVIELAFPQAIKELKFFPKPSELRDLALGNIETAVDEAWIAWREEAKRIGAYSDLQETTENYLCSWPVLLETLKEVFGGWPEACRAEYTDEMWASKRKEFGRVYHTLARRGRCQTTRLLGICSQDNLQRFGIAHPNSQLEAMTGIQKKLTGDSE